jgi:uncharacterized protein YhfF
MKITEEVQEFWNEFVATRQDVSPEAPFQVWHFGNTPELADELLDLVLQGKKYGTASLPWEFEDQPDQTPTVGTYSVVTDFYGHPKCVLRTKKVSVFPFNEVKAEHAFAEGEGDQSLDHWRGVHWHYFGHQCLELGREPSETMPVICEEFELLYPASNK